MSQLAEIDNLAGYLRAFGKTLSRKAIHSLHPLHVPGRDPLPDFGYIPEHRQPFEAQAHLIAVRSRRSTPTVPASSWASRGASPGSP